MDTIRNIPTICTPDEVEALAIMRAALESAEQGMGYGVGYGPETRALWAMALARHEGLKVIVPATAPKSKRHTVRRILRAMARVWGR